MPSSRWRCGHTSLKAGALTHPSVTALRATPVSSTSARLMAGIASCTVAAALRGFASKVLIPPDL
jgi:hypothetical protein